MHLSQVVTSHYLFGFLPSSPRHYAPQQPGGDVAEEKRVGDIVKPSFDNELTGRRRLHQLEKEKLEMMSTHNQQVRAHPLLNHHVANAGINSMWVFVCFIAVHIGGGTYPPPGLRGEWGS